MKGDTQHDRKDLFLYACAILCFYSVITLVVYGASVHTWIINKGYTYINTVTYFLTYIY